jgi:hypothetical protein
VADTVPVVVDLLLPDLPEAMRRELQALNEGRAPESFFCDRSPWENAITRRRRESSW